METSQSDKPLIVGALLGIMLGILLIVLVVVTGTFDHT